MWLIMSLDILNTECHCRVNKVHKDRMDLQVHQDQKATQVARENLEMMAILAYLDMMAHLENATIDQESL